MTIAKSKATITTPRPRIYMRSRIKVFKNTSRTKFRVGTVIQRNSSHVCDVRFDGDKTEDTVDLEDLTMWEFVEKDPGKRRRQRLQDLARARLEGKIPYRNCIPILFSPGSSHVTRFNPVLSSHTPTTVLQSSGSSHKLDDPSSPSYCAVVSRMQLLQIHPMNVESKHKNL